MATKDSAGFNRVCESRAGPSGVWKTCHYYVSNRGDKNQGITQKGRQYLNLNFPDLLTPLTEKGHVSLKMRKRRVSDSCRLLTAAPLLQKEYLSLDAHRPSRGDGERENERRGSDTKQSRSSFYCSPRQSRRTTHRKEKTVSDPGEEWEGWKGTAAPTGDVAIRKTNSGDSFLRGFHHKTSTECWDFWTPHPLSVRKI